MDRAHLAELNAFMMIAHHLSFRRAATDLSVTPSALSHSLRLLEEQLAIRLVNRTTRSVSLTEAGKRLYDQLTPAFQGIRTAVEDLNTFREAPIGTIRLNASRLALREVLIPLMAAFTRKNEHIKFEVKADDLVTDVVAEGFDAGVRFGELVAADMIAVPVGPSFKTALVASPKYLAAHGRPSHPRDLCGHRCVNYRFPSGKKFQWEFAKGKSKLDVEIEGCITIDDLDLVLRAAVEGAGIGYVFESQAKDFVARGKLELLLPEWCPTDRGFHLYYPSRRNLSFSMRAFLDFVRKTQRQ